MNFCTVNLNELEIAQNCAFPKLTDPIVAKINKPIAILESLLILQKETFISFNFCKSDRERKKFLQADRQIHVQPFHFLRNMEVKKVQRKNRIFVRC